MKWLRTAFDDHDLRRLRADAAQVPGFEPATGGLLVVSRAGCDLRRGQVDVVWGPADVVDAHLPPRRP
ncbi:hypothetical protein JQS43_07380 [Natronosporangium hydrolyticum]|uniref:Uncharacterized protein n=1 Tax=Natronosporangium hydrolyticum TaxID=2811111 RepID=A0A895YEA0_9ACTN|nr:hypothetical protein [Natronosporangium hydrolyticum]QSB16117.1 hypothetical protein JQS43_07380 [Natronosporangium hydrolyticum]